MTSVGVTLPLISVAAESSFTVTRLRAFVTTDLSDAALQSLLDAARADVDRVAGPVASRERLRVRGDLLMLSEPADTITAIVEDARGAAVTLAADDYEVSDSGRTLYRLWTGTNPARAWRGLVDVRYQRPDDTAERIRVMVALVQLDLVHQPGVASERIGNWEQSFTSNSAFNYELERASILASLGQAEGEIR
jgi:hypothetical protein